MGKSNSPITPLHCNIYKVKSVKNLGSFQRKPEAGGYECDPQCRGLGIHQHAEGGGWW